MYDTGGIKLNILVADYSGFCFGVKKAVSTVYNTTNNEGGSIYTYGPIIHNGKVVNELEQKGIRQLPSTDVLKENDTVIIRSHGVSKKVIYDLEQKKVNIIDATCPYVDSIHRKVEEFYNKGYQIIIIGDPSHPEVEGINGWCEGTAIIVDTEEQIDDLGKYSKVCIVAQTTINSNKWKNIVSALLSVSKEIIVFNTICNATEQRQKSAQEISKKSDAVIVLGGFNSSNTRKLVEICRVHCPRTYHLESIDELNIHDIADVKTLGITAGASTPDCIIKEAIDKMSNFVNTNEENNEKNLMDEYEKTLIRIHQGDIIKGKVIYAKDEEATVDIGYKADGLITKEELSVSGDISPKDMLKPGDEIEVFILKVNDGEGNVLLSKKVVDAEKNLEYIDKYCKDKSVVDARVIKIVKGGVVAEVKGVQVFIPASQLDNRYIEDLSSFINSNIRIIITEYDAEKKRVIGSRRIVLEEETRNKKKSILENLQVGEVITGNVSRITDFGAFVDLGGVDGLIHISELSWIRIKHPSEVVKEGDVVEVYVLSVDKDKERISLSLKKTVAEPWDNIEERIHAGDVIEGKVVRLASFGAFVEVEPGVDALVHISQISDKRISKVEDVLKVGDVVKAKVVELNTNDKRISLSIKEAIEDKIKAENNELMDNQQKAEDVTIKDMIDTKETE